MESIDSIKIIPIGAATKLRPKCGSDTLMSPCVDLIQQIRRSRRGTPVQELTHVCPYVSGIQRANLTFLRALFDHLLCSTGDLNGNLCHLEIYEDGPGLRKGGQHVSIWMYVQGLDYEVEGF